MLYANLMSLVAGISLLVASGCCAGRHLLLQPKPEGWPVTSPILKHVLFAFSAGLMFAGLKLLSVVADGSSAYPPNATPLFALLAVALAIYEGAVFVSEYRQWRVRVAALAEFRAKGYSIGKVISPE